MRNKVLGIVMSAVVMTASMAIAGEQAEYGGHCPVAYVMMNKAVKGDAAISMDFAGKHYVFANTDAKKMFKEDPPKFGVAYDGYCATAMSMGKTLDSDPSIFTVEHGVTYLFSSEDAKGMFDKDAHMIVEKADKEWAYNHASFDGYCPVAYVEMNKAVKGDEEITMHEAGSKIQFANAQAKKMYNDNAAKYQVAYAGHCATAASMGKWFASDATIFVVQDGTTYLFSSEMAKEMFEAAPAKVAGMADKKWAAAHH
jgi:YHS domain-containing protein